MISFFRRMIALVVWGIVTVFTLGRVELDRTGKTGGRDDPRRLQRPAVSRDLTEESDGLEKAPMAGVRE